MYNIIHEAIRSRKANKPRDRKAKETKKPTNHTKQEKLQEVEWPRSLETEKPRSQRNQEAKTRPKSQGTESREAAHAPRPKKNP